MLKGEICTLRTIRESDLPLLQAYRADISNRGPYYPHRIHSEFDVRQTYQRDGFWSQNTGVMLMVNQADAIVGEIEFFKPVSYWNAFEIAYLVYDQNERGKGITTEATQLLMRHLFETRTVNRIQLQIFPDNIASRRVAEKCGFTKEGTSRGVILHLGIHQDLDMYTIFREDVIK